MTDFLEQYEKTIMTLLEKKKTLSGTKRIDETQAKTWVQLQKTPLKKKVAQFFIDNTIYVSFSEFFDGIGELIKTNYETITNDGNRIVVVVGDKDKSQYLVAVIALYFIRKFNFREPDDFIDALRKGSYVDTEDHIIMFDDMSYSGSQMSNLLQTIYRSLYPFVVDDEAAAAKRLPKIKLLLYGVNPNSLARLNTVNVVKMKDELKSMGKGKTILIPTRRPAEIVSPFKTYYHKMFKTFREIDAEMCHLTNYFYAPFLQGHPYLSIYFDHKVADDVSTYMKVLTYGPIIPGSYSILSHQTNRDLFSEDFPDERLPSFIFDNTLTKKEIENILPELALKYGHLDPLDATDKITDFNPFLSDCTYTEEIYEKLRKIPYNRFVYPENTESGLLEHSIEWDFVHDNNTRCLKPFYKPLKKPMTDGERRTHFENIINGYNTRTSFGGKRSLHKKRSVSKTKKRSSSKTKKVSRTNKSKRRK